MLAFSSFLLKLTHNKYYLLYLQPLTLPAALCTCRIFRNVSHLPCSMTK